MEHSDAQQTATAALPQEKQRPVELTPLAVEMAKKVAVREGAGGRGLRVSVSGGGCSGFSYNLKFDSAVDGDTVYEIDGLEVIVDASSVEYLMGMTIDYVTGLHGAGFKFLNPNASRTCGCGTSFAV